MTHNDAIWKLAAVSDVYLNGVRGAVPMAPEQIAIMLRVLGAFRPRVRRFLDLGCGDGVLGEAVLRQYPQAHGILADYSPPMLAATQVRLSSRSAWVTLAELDYGTAAWLEHPAIRQHAPFDVIVAGFSIHHQPPERKQALYHEIYELLAPGGVFLNVEQVAPATAEIGALFDDLMVDYLWAYHQSQGSGDIRAAVAQSYYHRPDKEADELIDLETQCQWLRQIGFGQVDCYFKLFEIALFGGVK